MLLWLRAIALLIILPGMIGCQLFQNAKPPKGNSPLEPIKMAPDSVLLEVFFVRYPENEAQINGPLWDEIDEQHFSTALRRQLSQNGFRVGIVGSHLPLPLQRLLMSESGAPENSSEQLDQDPTVSRQKLKLHFGRQGEILTSSPLEQVAVLMSDEGGRVRGNDFRNAQCMLRVHATSEKDGRVRLKLLPELHHGKSKQKFVGRDGRFIFEASRDKEIYEALKTEAILSPGQSVVLGSLPKLSGSLGHHFFTEKSSQKLQQRLLVIRLTQIGQKP